MPRRSDCTLIATALAAGTTASVNGCAWANVCATASAYGVGAPQWTPAIVSGAGQTVAVGTNLQPITLQITDGAGHALQGAAVTLYQTVDAWEGACPSRGPCASAPVLSSATATAVSDATGSVTLTPLQLPAVAQVVNIAASTGTQGFIAWTLDITP